MEENIEDLMNKADYYKILNLSDLKKRNQVITDKMVERNYLAITDNYKKMAYNKGNNLRLEQMKETVKNKKNVSIEVLAHINGTYLTLLQKAYDALKTQEARDNYEERWNEIQQENKQKMEGQIDSNIKQDVKVQTREVEQSKQNISERELDVIPVNRKNRIERTTRVAKLTREMQMVNLKEQEQEQEQQKPTREIDVIPVNRPKTENEPRQDNGQRQENRTRIANNPRPESRTQQEQPKGEILSFKEILEKVKSENTSQLVSDISRKPTKEIKINRNINRNMNKKRTEINQEEREK